MAENADSQVVAESTGATTKENNPNAVVPLALPRSFGVLGGQDAFRNSQDRFKMITLAGFVFFVFLACMYFLSPVIRPSSQSAGAAVPSKTVGAGTPSATWTPLKVLVVVVTATMPPPTITPVPTQTARVVYVRVPTSTPVATALPVATATPSGGVVRDGDCWIFNLYGVRSVFVDGTPVAPAYGNVRVCGREVVIR